MTRAAIRREVALIRPFDEQEENHRADALAWIDSGALLFRTAKPAIPPKHLVSYFAVVDGWNILLVDHKKMRSSGSRLVAMFSPGNTLEKRLCVSSLRN